MSAAAPARIKYAWDRTGSEENAPQRKPATIERDWTKRRAEYLHEARRVPIRPPVRPKSVPPSAQTPVTVEAIEINALPSPPPQTVPPFSTPVEIYWHTRRCFVCAVTGPCEHREIEVAQAYLSKGRS